MIRSSVRRAFHTVHWIPPKNPVVEPAIFVPNHHGWHDGYVMYLALRALGLRQPFLDWIQEYASFPLFGKVGGMPFPANDPAARAATVKRTIRLMREEQRNLLLFAEGILHRPPEVMTFGKSLELVATKVEGSTVVPVAIRYEHSVHERPECWIMFGEPVVPGKDLAYRTRLEVKTLLDLLAVKIAFEPTAFEVLHRGTLDVNERWDMSRIPGRSRGKSQ